METKVNHQASIVVPANTNSVTPQQQFYFDPYSPFWILVGLAILFGQATSKRRK